ncbi:hypothetical protein M2132_001305 [Dysgonomonas sp. PH5-45]|uniref:DUF5672 family protein n=1 Tax=unclassified Dysgonomonas TaxID=2630389 RepID=UPI0024760D24|nr:MULTISPECIES: DUF5672 family protein [unclassified Dysgonomonas]MDH6354968.1 hypothetical protein [Dysgonomonas sp. PH5-45]MDH6387908.1 hypothetical protein [Dysgonomonas sp. PH5-37]
MTYTYLSKAVVIPVYKESVSHNEIISLSRCFEILGKNPIVFVCPLGLDLTEYYAIGDKHRVSISKEEFEPSFFEGLGGYNRLMLSKAFYERFCQYDRILIHQTDCFVFSDSFDYWCNFDYCGAPWIFNTEAKHVAANLFILSVRRFLKKILSKPNHWDTVQYKVGNGGFSIRNPKRFVEVIGQFEKNGIIERYRNPASHYYMEDVFWGVEVNRSSSRTLKVPGFSKALEFSFESLPSVCYGLNKERLPFGCHAWAKYDINFWKPHINKLGYEL